MYYTDQLIVPNYLCDMHDRISIWSTARLFQEAADHHVKTLNVGFRQLIAQGKAWVLSRMYYDVSRLPAEDQQVTVRTWSRGTDGLFAFREFQLIDAQGVAVSCTSYWVIIDLNTRHVLRMHDLIDGFETHPDLATDHPQLERLRIPRQAPQPIISASFPVCPSMLDHTNHVNNTEYIKWIFDHLPEPYASRTSYRFGIEFQLETQPTETVSLYSYIPDTPDTDPAYFKINNSRSTAVIAFLS